MKRIVGLEITTKILVNEDVIVDSWSSFLNQVEDEISDNIEKTFCAKVIGGKGSFIKESVEEVECECLNYEKYYHGGQKYGRCLDCGEEFEIY